MSHPVTLELTGTKITLRLASSQYDAYAVALAGKVENKALGVYQYTMSFQNLEKIFKVFNGTQLPKAVVTSGHEWLEKMRDKWRSYNNAKSQLRDIMKLERYPVEPNGKFAPYAHQTKMVGSTLVDPYTFVGADCGVGKTGAVARAVELLINQGEIRRGKVLISAPLSILEASWAQDLRSFTNLRFKILWTPQTNKTVKLGEAEVIAHGLPERPADAVTVRSKKGARWVKDGVIKEGKLNIFDQAEGGWEKMQVSWKEAVMPDGSTFPVGPITGQRTAKENTKEKFILDSLKDPEVDVFVINHDGVRIYEEILKAHNFEWVIVDESTKIKSIQSQVTQSHIEISWGSKRRTVMSGTPNPNGFLDLWSQFYFLDRGLTLSPSLKDYRHDYFTPVKIGHFGGRDAIKWELRDESLKQALIEKVKASSIFLKQRDCIDLPERTDLMREVQMSAEQSRVYENMERELVADLLDQRTGENLTIEAANTLAKLMKLRQITSGFVGHAEGMAAVESIDNNPKFTELDEFIEELQGQKLVIACQFREEIESLLSRYKDYGVAAIYGNENVQRRAENIHRFQTTDELQIMLLQPQAAAHGITLTKAHYFVFLSLDYNFEYYYQTGKRIERLGQKNPMFVYHFLARTSSGGRSIDHDLMEVLRSKSQDRDVLFNTSTDIVEVADTLRNRLIQRVNKK